ncbi:MAG: C-GCAxxG-C-C family protein [Defluviitaleaceae bacterium]|nr:C-GCAxxG-C-C family protein [Defluviitaleaceae bacterium]
MKKEINIAKVRSDAEEVFRSGKYICAEAIVHSIRENVDPNMPEALISAASGFPQGVGGARCMCGSVSGSVIALGYFFGRDFPTAITDPQSLKTIMLSFELQEDFKKKFKVLCCHVHLKGKDIEKGEHVEQCVSFTGEMAVKTAEIIARELKLNIVKEGVA